MKIFKIGKGFVGSHLSYECIDERLTTSSSMIRDILNLYKPDVLINCIGKTGRPNVDWCENNKKETYEANVTIPSILAAECEKLGIHLVHLSSGCIYFGESPNYNLQWENRNNPKLEEKCIPIEMGWKENDFANPKSYYSKTKYACDLILGEMPNVTSLRLRMPISTKNDPRNFINKVRCYKQVIDIPNSMTMMDDLVRCIDWVAKQNKFGIFHVTNPGPLTAAQVMRKFQEYSPNHKFDVINESELDKLTLAKRSNCILDTNKLIKAGFQMTPSMEALDKCMANYIKNI